MSGVEALARVLRAAMTTWAVCVHSEGRCAAHDEPEPCTAPHDVATELLADPGPLLAALAEAGVLTEQESDPHRGHGCWQDPDEREGWQECGSDTNERRYVSEWRPADARA